ncbi:MAG: sigma-54 dependent transcriptional regulator [Oryzomonas sp.]|uniref:sigma-54-dependent transcriptional regulator n=1 Tax=Oryzomonas sp. TaxID=2855186 RepID=UPI0028465C3F|nr:sigma-54 dependent transcriptional regulator [Oryzomonas sp.]MDR3578331.1 sigma-54 dependent transcriptional regulator [Oryzomonas sp.]
MTPRILLIEDDAGSRFGFVRYFSKEGYAIHEAADLAEAGKAVASQRFDAIILDVNLPDGSGIDFITTVRATDAHVAIIVITGSGDIPLAVDAMRRGADNFLVKPINNAGLAVYLEKNLEVGDLKRSQAARQRMEKGQETFFGNEPSMCRIHELARLAADSDCPVLLTGDTGAGKGMLARWIHANSPRSRYEFVEVNCSGLQGELLSREIFGNVRGAFTSADQDRKGLLDIADRGTLFLDEIGDMNSGVQAQFLKVLEEKSYRRLGDVKLLKSDFRLICATNRDIGELVAAGQFRQDLVYRINLMPIHIPPLRERREDLPQLVSRLLLALGTVESTISDEALELLMSYSWPGNIRELKNILERALLLARGARLDAIHFPGLGRSAPAVPRNAPVHDAMDNYILTVFNQMGEDADRAAAQLGISRATLYRRIKRLRS